jgi:hypothetical protein
MCFVSVVHSSPEFLLYELLPGKPDPQAHCTPETLLHDNRPRVDQAAQKSCTCWYYALNMIRARIGKLSSSDLRKERECEKACSNYRKKITAAWETLPLLLKLHLTEHPLISLAEKVPKETLAANLQVIEKINYSCDSATQTIIHDFAKVSQTQTFASFLNEKVETVFSTLYQNFYSQIGVLELFKKEPVSPDTYLNSIFSTYICATLYNLTVLPDSTVSNESDLFSALSKHGPLVITGDYGYQYYTLPPQKLTTSFHNAEVYGWPIGSFKGAKKSSFFSHIITVIGIERRKDKSFIYYNDPMDKSPASSIRKIYKISYTAFRDHITPSKINNIYAASEVVKRSIIKIQAK